VSCPYRKCLDFSYENGAASSFLVAKTDEKEKVQAYQIEMIRSNYIDYLLPLDARGKDDKICFYYDITSRLTLTQYLKRVKLKREEFLMLVGNVSRALLDCRYYLLKNTSIFLDTDYIFINPSARSVSFVYIPLNIEVDINRYFRQFIIDIVLYKADIDDSCNDNFLQRVIGYAKTEMFNVGGFDALVKSMSVADGFRADAGRTSPPIETDVDKSNNAKEPFEHKSSKRLVARPLIVTVLLQVIIVAVFGVGINVLKAKGQGEAASYAALALILGAVDTLVLKKMFGSGAVIIKKSDANADKQLQVEVPVKEKKDGAASDKTADEGKNSIILPVRHEQRFERPNETTLLVESKNTFPYLKSVKEGKYDNIAINKTDFIIGRLKEQVDFIVNNGAIGKVHVSITNHDGKYFIKDLNSRNGTYINGKRITSNMEYEINDRDKISLASCDYIFIIP
jgi:hypothetical protein